MAADKARTRRARRGCTGVTTGLTKRRGRASLADAARRAAASVTALQAIDITYFLFDHPARARRRLGVILGRPWRGLKARLGATTSPTENRMKGWSHEQARWPQQRTSGRITAPPRRRLSARGAVEAGWSRVAYLSGRNLGGWPHPVVGHRCRGFDPRRRRPGCCGMLIAFGCMRLRPGGSNRFGRGRGFRGRRRGILGGWRGLRWLALGGRRRGRRGRLRPDEIVGASGEA